MSNGAAAGVTAGDDCAVPVAGVLAGVPGAGAAALAGVVLAGVVLAGGDAAGVTAGAV